jgi:alpha-tubulin suppressor-like RCC1 family protein
LEFSKNLLQKSEDNHQINDNEIHVFGNFSQKTEEIFKFPKEETIRKISLGKKHAIVLFFSGRIAVIGDNSNGQLGLPLKNSCETNKDFIENWLLYYPKVDNLRNAIIHDIACGDMYSLLLLNNDCNNDRGINYLIRFGFKEENRYKENIEKLSVIVRMLKLNFNFSWIIKHLIFIF